MIDRVSEESHASERFDILFEGFLHSLHRDL